MEEQVMTLLLQMNGFMLMAMDMDQLTGEI